MGEEYDLTLMIWFVWWFSMVMIGISIAIIAVKLYEKFRKKINKSDTY